MSEVGSGFEKASSYWLRPLLKCRSCGSLMTDEDQSTHEFLHTTIDKLLGMLKQLTGAPEEDK